jgi:hypothetical protein
LCARCEKSIREKEAAALNLTWADQQHLALLSATKTRYEDVKPARPGFAAIEKSAY